MKQSKNIIFTFSVLFVLCTLVTKNMFAQTPSAGIFFQAVARDNFSNQAKDRKIYVQSSIIQSTTTGTKVLTEEYQTSTDASGVFSISIGQGTRIGGTANNLTSIDWSKGPYYLNLKIAISPIAPVASWDYKKEWIDLGTTSFGAVPYALYAGTAAGIDQKININDTTKMLSNYAKAQAVKSLETNLNTKLSAADTLSMLAPYSKTAFTIDSIFVKSQIVTKLSLTDTAAMLANYLVALNALKAAKLNASDTIWLSTRINDKANIAELNSGLALKESVSNKSTATDLGGLTPSDILYPTQSAVKAFVTANSSSSGVVDGGITSIKLADQAVTDAKLATGISKSKVGLSNVENTTDALKPISIATQSALDLKANTSDVTTSLALKANTSDVTTSLAAKANTTDVTTGLALKVDKVTGKDLSTNDYTSAEKTKLAAITGTNTGDQDLSSYATTSALALKANTSDLNTSLSLKANTEDVNTNLAAKASASDLTSGLALKANAADVNTSLATKASSSDLTSGLALKESVSNKSTATDLGGLTPSDILYPTQKAVKDYVTANTSSGGVADLGITTIKLADLAVTDAKLATGISKSKVGLGNVENTALSTWGGTNNLTSVGTITSGVWNGTAVAIVNGGTGATTAAAARTNLGLVIGANVQAPLIAGTDYLSPTGSAAQLTNFPTLNQNTSGTAAGLSAAYINWDAASGGTSILNKPTITNGTVTNVAALTLGATGSDITSTVANTTTTPVITLNIPTASATNRGALTSADFTTFNNKQSALTMSTGLTNSSGTVTVNSSQNIATLSNLTSNGIVTTEGGTGTLSVTATTGTGDVVRATSPTLVTPILGTPASGVATNLTGTATALNIGGNAATATLATNVTTNANLTGDVISTGNATTITNNAVTTDKILNANVTSSKIASGAITDEKVTDVASTKITGIITVANGGTGSSSLTQNNVLLGNGSSALQVVAPGTSGNVLTSDGSTWTSTAATHFIGELYGGGKVFYIYDGGKHGLIAALSDIGTYMKWSMPLVNTRARGDGVGAGLKNTAIIIAVQTGIYTPAYDGNPFAATECNEYSVTETVNLISTKYGDWYLPSKYELNLLYLQKSLFTNWSNESYWSSTEASSSSSWRQNFSSGSQTQVLKEYTQHVRAIRAF